MSRLVIVSNRVPPVRGRTRGAAAGGLAAGLSSALKAFGGLWFGWSGEVQDTQDTSVTSHQQDNYTLATIHLSKENHEEYYNGFANRALWPLCHYRPDLVAYDRSFSVGYYRVNSLFAEAMLPLLRSDDLIWVQDYHLIPCGAELQRLGASQKMGFFMHIPWPSAELVITLPEHLALVRALFAYDVVGFQTYRDVQSFLDYVLHETDGVLEPDGRVTCFGRTIHVRAFPIGINAKSISEMAEHPEARAHVARMLDSLAGRRLIIGVDRLDYSKGIDRRFSAYAKLLHLFPEHRTKVSMLQIAPPSRMDVRAYRSIRRELERGLGRINGEFADYDWVPLRYVNKTYNHIALAGLFRTACIAFVTPLRDGMNLVAKEYVAAQDPEDPGVLILSRFAGAARQLRDALIVNPFDEQSMVEALHRALKMPLEERRARWQALMENVVDENIDRWRDGFLQTLTAAREQ
jgi:trehalose 6-phosphate synthase